MVSIVKKTRVNRLMWFGLVMRRDELEAEKMGRYKSIQKENEGKNKWLNVIKSDLKPTGVNK